MHVFGTERRPPDQAFKQDGPHAPPVAVLSVTVRDEDFGSDVIGRSNSTESQLTSLLPPRVHLCSVVDGKIDLIQSNRVTIPWTTGSTGQELLIVALVMQLVEPGGKAKVGELDVALLVQQYVVWLDITVMHTLAATPIMWITRILCLPMDETKLVNCGDGFYHFCSIESGHVF